MIALSWGYLEGPALVVVALALTASGNRQRPDELAGRCLTIRGGVAVRKDSISERRRQG